MNNIVENVQESVKGCVTQEFFTLLSCFSKIQANRSSIISHIAGNTDDVKAQGKVKISELDSQLKPIMTRLTELGELDEVKNSISEVQDKVYEFIKTEELT